MKVIGHFVWAISLIFKLFIRQLSENLTFTSRNTWNRLQPNIQLLLFYLFIAYIVTNTHTEQLLIFKTLHANLIVNLYLTATSLVCCKISDNQFRPVVN